MTDRLTEERRSALMARIKGKNTVPELAVRRLAHSLGYRFRLHRPDLPGTPDLVFPSRRKVIFVHGCFWHGHGCSKGRLPKSKLDFWAPKIAANRRRDARQRRLLKAAGWSSLVIWACGIAHQEPLIGLITEFLEHTGYSTSRPLGHAILSPRQRRSPSDRTSQKQHAVK